MSTWIKDHILEALSLSGFSVTGAIALAKDALALGATDIDAFAFWSVACISLGFLIGLLVAKNAKAVAEARASAETAKSNDAKELELRRIEMEESERRRLAEAEDAKNRHALEVREKFARLNRKQAEIVKTAASNKDGYSEYVENRDYDAVVYLDSAVGGVISVMPEDEYYVRIRLTPEWNMLMNEYSDIFNEVHGGKPKE